MAQLEALFEAGVESLRAGRLADARAAFRSVLNAAPHHPDAHYLLAHTAFLAGEMAEAERCMEGALAHDPRRADFHLFLGNVLQRQGKLEQAERKYRDALGLDPRLAEAQLNLGNVLGEAGRADEALAAYDAAIAAKPGLLPAYLNRAAVQQRLKGVAEARAEYARIEALFPQAPDALYGRARLEQEAGDAEEARRRYAKLLAAYPDHAHGHNSLGVLLASSDPARALEHFERCLAADPQHRQALGNAARVLRAQGKFERAASLLQRLLKLDPQNDAERLYLGETLGDARRYAEGLLELFAVRKRHPDWAQAHLGIADIYFQIGRPEKSLAANTRALALEPQNFMARLNQALYTGESGEPQAALEQLWPLLAEAPGNAKVLNAVGLELCALNRYPEGIAHFRQAVAQAPNDSQVHSNLSLALLATHQFAEGWKHQGMKWGLRENALLRREYDCPLWRGQSLAGKSIYVWAEQGIGDHVMFGNMFPDLLARGARCTFEVNSRLERLFRRSFPGAEIVALKQRKAPPRRTDYHVPMSGLGEFLRRSAAEFPPHSGYLAADSARRAHWRTRLTALGPGRRIGISWRGGTPRTDRRARSLALEQLRPILELPGMRFVSLQYGDCRAEVEAMRVQGYPLAHWQEAIDDFDECAALLCELDLVVSVTTTLIHLAGALARPVWVLVPARPTWRYGIEGERLPWYPSARLWRQERLDDWQPLIARVAKAIEGFS
jgi:tetratricopeptide (TPR) repeat protein